MKHNSLKGLLCAKNRTKHFRFSLFALFLFLAQLQAAKAQVTCMSSGTWASATWNPAAPTAGQTVIVAVGCTLTVDVNTPIINDLTINGKVIVSNSATSYLSIAGNLVVNTGAALENNGSIEFVTPNKSFALNGTATYIHNPRNNVSLDESIFYNSTEAFAATSNLFIQKWSDGSIPLGDPSRVASSIFGNLTLAATVSGGSWDQDGYFATNRIRGSFTVSASTIVMDDGTGVSTSLFLQDVLINGTGNIVFQRGLNRSLALSTNNFTISSVAPAKPTVIMDTCYGVLNWVVTGNLNINYDFNAVFGSTFASGADIRVTVTGNLNLTGGNIIFNNKADAPLRLTVNGTTTFNNTTVGGTTCLIEGGNGALTMTTQDLVISAGNPNYFQGKAGAAVLAKGAATITINNDLTVNGTATTYFAYSDSITAKVRVESKRDILLNGTAAYTVGAYTNGAFTISAIRNFTQTKGQFVGQLYPSNLSIDSLIVGSDFTFNSTTASDYFKGNRSAGNTFFRTIGNFNIINSGLASGQGVIGVDSSAGSLLFSVGGNLVQNGGSFSGILNGSGAATFNITGMVDVNAGSFKGHNNIVYSNTGTITFTAGSIDFDGGLFSGFYSCNNSSLTGVFTINGNCKVNFTAASDEFTFIGIGKVGFDNNNLLLTLNITGTLIISGANGTFISSQSGGMENITLGNASISNGNNSFNCTQANALSTGHTVKMTVLGNFSVSGGTNFLSASTQNDTILVNNDIIITGGSLSVKGADATASIVNVLGGYSQTGGTFYMHNNVSDPLGASSSVIMTVNSNDDASGDFTHTAGTFYFDNSTTVAGSLNMALNVKSPNYTLGGNGNMTMTNPGVGSVTGTINFARNGTINFSRSGTHDIQQIRQNMLLNCIVDMISGDLQLASHQIPSALPDWMLINVGGTLAMRTNKLHTNAVKMYSGITNLGRVRTQNVNGLYNATTNAAFSTTVADSLDFYLATSSYVEYYGVDNQIVTGVGVGKARAPQHKYGNLEINFSGTANSEYVYPTNIPHDSATIVRTSLILTNGELNLDNDHNPSNGGGRMIVIEMKQASGMARTNGYIRSETENGTGNVKWLMGNFLTSHIFHFGYDASNYIPLTFTPASGTVDTVKIGTYHTNFANLPYPPTVTHVRNNSGLDNSAYSVDRFWNIDITGTSATANILFKATPAEVGTISTLLAQRWVAPIVSWTNPVPGTQSSVTNGTQANTLGTLSTWWTLSGSANLLPVELVQFKGGCDSKDINLSWTTATEINNSYFTIERSLDGLEWEIAGTVPGSNNSSQLIDYSFIDRHGFGQNSFYRLTQTDFDGRSETFDPIKVRTCSELDQISVYVSSKTTGNSNAYLNSPYKGQFTLEIFASNGSVIENRIVQIEKGFNTLVLNTENLSQGIYYLRLQSPTDLLTQKFIVGKE
ncbi:MAG: hypothetical protein IPG90_05820 [Bacteroidetes bacterium]|nr:hypothetical protein [Bacteroidota bacterium]